jgi:hypothetical protein
MDGHREKLNEAIAARDEARDAIFRDTTLRDLEFVREDKSERMVQLAYKHTKGKVFFGRDAGAELISFALGEWVAPRVVERPAFGAGDGMIMSNDRGGNGALPSPLPGSISPSDATPRTRSME